jgi:integrase
MARRRGSVVPPNLAKGHATWALRFHAYGRRRYVTTRETTRDGAERELERVLAQVLLGVWEPRAPTQQPDELSPAAVAAPSFHRYASDWLDGKRHELKPRSVEKLTWSLECHLLPWFGELDVAGITKRDVDRYRQAKQRDRVPAPPGSRQAWAVGLGDRSINQTLTVLATILDAAIDHEIRPGPNPAKGKERRIRTAGQPRRNWLELPQLRALLAAADADGDHRALIACMLLGGLRVSEACALRWRDVDLANGRLHVAESKTDAGRRTLDPVWPPLRDELAALRARTPNAEPDALLFVTRRGRQRTRNNVRVNVLLPAVERANVALEQAGELSIASCTNHDLRRTYCAFAFACGATVPEAMAALGHTDPKMTLGVYSKLIARNDSTGVRAAEMLGTGSGAVDSGSEPDGTFDAAVAQLLDDA